MNKAQGGRINIKGTITADSGTTLNFLAKLGMRVNGNFIEIKEASVNVQVIDPQLFISQQINGSSNYIASPGELLRYEVFFRNIGSTPFDNLFMTVKLDSPGFDISSIQPQNGGQVNGNIIVWDYKQVNGLKYLNSQEEQSVRFDVKLKDGWALSDSQKNNITVRDIVSISQTTQNFDTKVNSKLDFSQKGFYQGSSILNSGPVPPISGKMTTYTITWTVKDSFNDVKNIKVKANLAQNVSLTGKLDPQNESSKFSFDSSSREIVWSAGDVSAGNSKTLSFQISLAPSESQKYFVADLISQATATAEDQATGAIITAQSNGVNTNLPDDSTASGKGTVQ